MNPARLSASKIMISTAAHDEVIDKHDQEQRSNLGRNLFVRFRSPESQGRQCVSEKRELKLGTDMAVPRGRMPTSLDVGPARRSAAESTTRCGAGGYSIMPLRRLTRGG